MLKKLFTFSIFLLILSVTNINQSMADENDAIEVGGSLSEATLHAITGESHTLSQYRGKPLLINIWASWCGHCRNEMHSLELLSHKINRKQFNMIGISTDDDVDNAAKLVRDAKLSFKNYVDKNLELENMFGANAIPMTILVDSNGRIIKKISGSKKWNSPEYIQLIEDSLQVSLK